MSHSWPPQEPWPPRQGRPQPPYGQPPEAGSTGAGYGQSGGEYGNEQPGPSWGQQQPGGWPPAEAEGWPQPQGPTSRPLYPQYQQYPQPSQYPQYGAQSQYPSHYSQYAPQSQYPQYQPHQQDPWQQQQQQQYSAPYGYGEPYETRRSFGWLLPVVLVVVLLLVAGAGVYVLTGRNAHPPAAQATTAATSPAGTPSVPKGFRAFTDTAAHIRFAIPIGWTNTGGASSAAEGDGLELGSPSHDSAFAVKEIDVSSNDPVGAETAADTAALAGAAGPGGITNKQGPANARFAGETWVQESGDTTMSGERVHIVVLATTHNHATYLLAYVALASSFTSANTHYFQPIQNSFAFTQ